MKIKDIQERQKIDTIGEVIWLKELEKIEKEGKEMFIRNGRMKDDTGEINFKIWNQCAATVTEGDTLKITKGYVKPSGISNSGEKFEKYITNGVYGRCEVVENVRD